jgi:phage protein D
MVCQFDMTDAGFLKERAARIGYELFVRDDTLYFRKPAEKETKGQLMLEWGKNLESLDVNVNVGGQIAQVEVRSMDRMKRETISYKTTDGDLKSLVPKGMSGAKARETLFGGKPLVITSIPVNTKEEAKAIAVARLRRAMESFVTVRGATFGMPDLRPGTGVTINGIDPILAGDYYLTRCTHRFGAQGYRSDFEARRLEL